MERIIYDHHMIMLDLDKLGILRQTKQNKTKLYLDCFPSGKFCVGFSVPPVEHATIIFASLPIFASTPAPRQHMLLIAVSLMSNQTAVTLFLNQTAVTLAIILCKNSGFSSVPANMPKNANAARLAISQAVHSFINLYICTLMAPGG
jgi:hypothetical protein